MKQIFQNLKTGEIIMEELPTPLAKSGYVLIRNRKSAVSLGTERMLIEFGKAGWINTARQKPDKVEQVIDKIKTDGLKSAVNAVFTKLDKPLPLGYSCAGEVIGIGENVKKFKKGDRVISNGSHAEIVSVPENLCAKIPENIDYTTASFTVISAVALHGIRLLNPSLGENIAVIGLGLIGLITCQILKANGCDVIGFDIDDKKAEAAKKFGIQAFNINKINPVETAIAFSSGFGADGVLITTATESGKPIEYASRMCRKKGRIILVGVAGLHLDREQFYNKEISFQVSCSYGPGRYEKEYEEKGLDYPIGFVRWTAQRNFEAALSLMSQKKLVFDDLITEIIPFNRAASAYKNRENALGLVFDYPDEINKDLKTVVLRNNINFKKEAEVRIGVIGAGEYAGAVFLPALFKTDAKLIAIASRSGISGNHLGKKFGFIETSSDYNTILENKDINAVVILTRHDLHAELVIKGLKANKHIFVEKPLALNKDELKEIEEIYKDFSYLNLMTGFNRRFSPHVIKIKEILRERMEPLSMIMTVNAGTLPNDHWALDAHEGGGRIIGEACHFIDLLSFIADSPVYKVFAMQIGSCSDNICEDKISVQLYFKDGSTGTIHYFANGSRKFPKERLEIFSSAGILQLDNFKKLKGWGFVEFKKLNLISQDKGHKAMIKAFVNSVKANEKPLIPFDNIKNTSLASFAVLESIKTEKVVILL